MNRLPKNIDDLDEFLKYYKSHGNPSGYNYTIDDFIEDYRISMRTAKDLLKHVDYVSITDRLYKNESKLTRKHYYNKDILIRSLFEQDVIKFEIRHKHIVDSELRENKVRTLPLTKEIVMKHFRTFKYYLDMSLSTKEMVDQDVPEEDLKKENVRINRELKTLDSVGITIGKGVKRYYIIDNLSKIELTLLHSIVSDTIDLIKKVQDI